MAAGDSVDENSALHVPAAPHADAVGDSGDNPVGGAAVVHLEGKVLIEHFGGILKPGVAANIAQEQLGGGIFHPLLQTHQLGVLGDHIHLNVGGQALLVIVKPFDDVAVNQGGDPHGTVVQVDLGVILRNLELGNQVGHLAQLALAQLLGGVPVDDGDLIHGQLGHVGGEIAGFGLEQIPIPGGMEEGDAGQHQHQRQDKNSAEDQKHHFCKPGHGAALRHRLARLAADGEVGQAGQGRQQPGEGNGSQHHHQGQDDERPEQGAGGMERGQHEPIQQKDHDSSQHAANHAGF